MTQKYKIINQYSEDYSFDAVPLNWDYIPEEISEKIPGEYYSNVYAATESGEIIEKTVVFLDPVKSFAEKSETFELEPGVFIQLPDGK